MQFNFQKNIFCLCRNYNLKIQTPIYFSEIIHSTSALLGTPFWYRVRHRFAFRIPLILLLWSMLTHSITQLLQIYRSHTRDANALFRYLFFKTQLITLFHQLFCTRHIVQGKTAVALETTNAISTF